MGDSVKYVLDANVFIEAHRNYYAFDLVSAFWHFLLCSAQDQVRSIDRIYDEIAHVDAQRRPKDELADWAMNEALVIFKPTDQDDVVQAYQEIMRWALNHDQFSEEAKAAFAEDADAWTVGYAKAKGLTVVTHEAFHPDIKTDIKIPNACSAFDVSWINTFEMLRRLRFFVDEYTIRE